MVRRFVLLALLRLSSALFETCDETFQLDTDASVTISSGSTLNARNVSSCRYTLVAPANYIVDVTCRLEIDQPESQQCPLKRFFVSVDGMKDLRGADYFCNRIGSRRKVRRRSVMNRLVLAYATKEAYVGDEKFVCVARRVEVSCDCGWAKRVRYHLVVLLPMTLKGMHISGENIQRRRRTDTWVSIDDCTRRFVYQSRVLWGRHH